MQEVGATFGPPLSEHQILVLLVQLALLVGVARLFGFAMRAIGQPAVIGELAAGILLGPTVLGRVAPRAFDWLFGDQGVMSATFAVAWLGVVMLVVVIGFETDLGLITRFRRVALATTAGGLGLSLVVNGAAAWQVPDSFVGAGAGREVFAGFFAVALSVSALPVIAKILQDLGLIRRDFAQVTLAVAVLIDTIGWLLLAALAGLAQDALELGALGETVVGLALFLVAVVVLVRPLLDRLFRAAMARGGSVTAGFTIAIVAALAAGAVTHALGFEAIIGAFVIGIVLAGLRHQIPEVRTRMETVTAAFFAPIFFVYSGLRVDFGLLDTRPELVWAAGVVVISVVAKMAGSFVGAKASGMASPDAIATGAALSALGAMGIVAALVGLNLGVLSDSGYTVLVTAALVTTILAPGLVRLVVSRRDMTGQEQERLQRESVEESAQLLGARRILLPTRGGTSSRYAARLVTAVFPQAEVTVLAVDPASLRWWRRMLRRVDADRADPSDVLDELPQARSVHKISPDPAAAIAAEARLGYDLVVLGASEHDRGSRMFSDVLERVLAVIDLPTVVVRFPQDRPVPSRLPDRILVPVSAAWSTRAAEELAYSLAGIEGGSVLALHVVNRPEGQGVMLESPAVAEGMEAGRELVAAAARFGGQLGVEVTTEVRIGTNAEQEIVDHANEGDFDLLVLGASSRPLTGRPFYGHRVSYVLEHVQVPVAVVSFSALS
ncbi:MAG TPA: cation:proton antiporter [Acidimicrobiia bacterium]